MHFKHFCMSDCKCRPTASTCDPSINLPVHYRDMPAFEEVMTSALEEGLGFGLIYEVINGCYCGVTLCLVLGIQV